MHAPPHLPAPLRTSSDCVFAHQTLTKRLTGIIADVATHQASDGVSDDLLHFRDRVIEDKPLQLFDGLAPDTDDWQRYFSVHQHETWHTTVWYFAETLLYRMVIQLVRWWEFQQDPFMYAKNAELKNPVLWDTLRQALAIEADPIFQLIDMSMWGNRLDLSYADSAQLGMTNIDPQFRLVDDRRQLLAHINHAQNGDSIHLITDNFGSELAMDLALIDALLTLYPISVVLHLKLHPTYVSDSTTPNVLHFVAEAKQYHDKSVADFGKRLHNHLESGRIRLAPDLFWNSPLFFWQLPPRLQTALGQAHLTIIKGDVNYRRIVGDAVWPVATPFSDVAGYFPSPVTALRTLKSDPVVGIGDHHAAVLDVEDAAWRVNGKRGVIQFAMAQTP